jgi:hypothetical protein
MKLPWGEYRPDVTDLDGKLTRFLLNVVPRGDGYGPFSSLEVLTAALPAPCRGAFMARSPSDGSVVIFAGTETKLYRLNNTTLAWDDVSKGASTYGDLDSDACWSFCQFGARIIAAQRNSAMQTYVLNSSSEFADVGGSAPAAGWVATLGSFVVACDINGSPQDVAWCSINNPTAWAATVNLADTQTLPDGGRTRCVAEVSNQVGIILQEGGIRRMVFAPGSAAVFQIEKIRTDIGILGPRSFTVAAGFGFFLSTKGVIQIDASGNCVAIGEERVDRTILGQHLASAPQAIRSLAYDSGSPGLVFSVADPKRNLWFLFYKTQGGTAGQFDRGFVYSWSLQRWSTVSVSGEFVLQAATPGLTLEALDALAPGAQNISGAANNGSGLVRLTVGSTSGWTTGDVKTISAVTGTTEANGTWTITVIDGTHIDLQGSAYAHAYVSGGVVGGSIDAMTLSLDEISVAALNSIAAFSSAHKLGFFGTSPVEATVVTAERSSEGARLNINNHRPITDASEAYCTTLYRDNLREELSEWPESDAMDSDGNCPVLDEGRYVRVRMRIPAGVPWTFAAGVETEVSKAGGF